jgi:TRAP-type transport system periplasmic protein
MKKTSCSRVLVLIFTTLVLSCFFSFGHSSQSRAAAPMVLSFSSWGTEKDPGLVGWTAMAKDLEQVTKGGVKVKFYHAEALGKAREHYELALKGTADMSYMNVSFTPGRFPITDLISFSYAPSAEAMAAGLNELTGKGYLDKEYAQVKLLFAYAGAPSHLLWRKGVKPATTLADFKGKKIRIPGAAAKDLIAALGATPLNMPMPEVYMALERGVMDGAFTSINTLDVFRLAHVVNEITYMDIMTFAFGVIMNKNSWEKLPKEAKDVLEKNRYNYALTSSRAMDRDDAKAIENNKPKIYKLAPAETARLKEIVGPSVTAYVKKYEEAGFPVRQAAHDYNAFMKQKYGEDAFAAGF